MNIKPITLTLATENGSGKSAFGDFDYVSDTATLTGVFGKIVFNRIEMYGNGGWWSINWAMSDKTVSLELWQKHSRACKQLDDVVHWVGEMHNEIIREWLYE